MGVRKKTKTTQGRGIPVMSETFVVLFGLIGGLWPNTSQASA